MIPRKQLDIHWSDLAAAMSYSLLPADAQARQQQLEADLDARCGDTLHSLASLSVRSGLDALLSAWDLPRGCEILVSQVTIGDMMKVLEKHGLRPVLIAVNPDTLAVDEDALEAGRTAATCAVLVAHLFGGRMPMEPVIAFARRHGLPVLEDGAQAYGAPGWMGDPGSDVVFLSFGPIKTATALGGAVLRFRDPALRERVRHQQAGWPRQSRMAFLRRVAKFAMLKLASHRHCHGGLMRVLAACGVDADAWINQAARGFAGGDLFVRLRHRPGAPLLRLLGRRLSVDPQRHMRERTRQGDALLARLPGLRRPGAHAIAGTHWVVPVCSEDPAGLVQALRNAGFDATRGTSSLQAFPLPRVGHDPMSVLMASLVYLPLISSMDDAELHRLADAVLDAEGMKAGAPRLPGRPVAQR